MDVIDRVYFPHSLGLLYLAITQYLGFKKYGDEYKVMGLAPYGKPTRTLAARKARAADGHGGGFALDLDYFRHWTGEISMSWESGEPTVPDVYTDRLIDLLGPGAAPGGSGDVPARRSRGLDADASSKTPRFTCCAACTRACPSDALCLAGGCAMNSVANGKIRQNTPFKQVFIQPAAGDNGTALGAALEAWHASGERVRRSAHGAFVLGHRIRRATRSPP